MKQLITMLLLAIAMMASAQQGQTSPNVKAKTEVATQASLTKAATKTPLLYQGMPVYKSAKGKYFVVKQSKKTNNWYKVYVEVK